MTSDQAGWRRCPSGLDQQRYWDGRSWTSSVRPNSLSASYDSRTRAPRMFPDPSFAPPPDPSGTTASRRHSLWPATPGVFGSDSSTDAGADPESATEPAAEAP
ncbi:MAG: DUF2510 domain-containing protein, partial [Sporichthyaceae bacterium]|nr:DUF2510 domain-containing protein [Sporichthyaceae bacterium]